MRDADASTDRRDISGGAKLFAAAMVLIGVLKLADIAYAGYTHERLLAGIGFLAMAYGMAKNGFGKVRPIDVAGRHASTIGAVFVLISFVLRWTK